MEAILPSSDLAEDVSAALESAWEKAGSAHKIMLRGRMNSEFAEGHVAPANQPTLGTFRSYGSEGPRSISSAGGGLFGPRSGRATGNGTGCAPRGPGPSSDTSILAKQQSRGAMTAAAILAKLSGDENDGQCSSDTAPKNFSAESSISSFGRGTSDEDRPPFKPPPSAQTGLDSEGREPCLEEEGGCRDSVPSPASPRDASSPTEPVSECSMEPTRAPASTAEAVSILVDKMLESPEDEELQTRAMRSLRRLSTDEEGRRLIGNGGGIELVSDCMRRFGNNDQLISTCCMVVANLCYGSDRNKERCRKSRCIDHIVTHLASFIMPGKDMSYVCLAARNVTNNCRANQLYFCTNGGAEALCKAISRYEDDVDVQTQAIAAVGNAAHLNKTSQMKLRESGILELLIETMKRHRSQESIQKSSVVAIAHLSADNERNRRELGFFGAVDQIVGMMRLYRSNEDLQVSGCVALRHLAFDEENRDIIGSCGGIPIILDAMSLLRRHNAHNEVTEILKALSNSTFDHTENKLTIFSCGGVETVSSLVVRDTPGSILEGALRVLRNVTDCSEDVREAIRESDVIYTILDCMRDRKTDAGVAEHALALLLNLLADGLDMAGSVGDLDPVEVSTLIQNWMVMFPGVTNIQIHGESLIRQFEMSMDHGYGPGSGLFRRGKLKKASKKIGKHLPFGKIHGNRSEAVEFAGDDSDQGYEN